MGLNSGDMSIKGGVKWVSPLRIEKIVRVEKRKSIISFWRKQEKRREEKRRGERGNPRSTRGKGVISYCYGCMWFYAMGSMYVWDWVFQFHDFWNVRVCVESMKLLINDVFNVLEWVPIC